MKSLKEIRLSKGLSQQELEEITGIAQQSLSLYEKGKVIPNVSTKKTIESALGQKVNWLETEPLELKDTSWHKAERLLKRLIETTVTMRPIQRKRFTRLVKKYF